MPDCSCNPASMDYLHHHMPYIDHSIDLTVPAAGDAFLYCQDNSVSLLNTPRYNNPRVPSLCWASSACLGKPGVPIAKPLNIVFSTRASALIMDSACGAPLELSRTLTVA
ncbi:TPA: hypothetical protein ACH3X2_002303 [Trebouxia sp. C0005]